MNKITEGVIWKQILTFFFPILLGTFFQQLYNTSDAIIVGRFLGKEALAAVGGGTGTLINLLVGFFTGLSSGATVIISQFYGAKNEKDTSCAVHTAIALAFIAGIIISIVGLSFSRFALTMIGTPEDMFDSALTYIRIYFTGIIASIIYNMGAGILRAVGDSKRPLYFLIVSCIINIILDIVFIAVFHWGIAGAAWATVFSQVVSMYLVLRCLTHTTESYVLEIKKIRLIPSFLLKIVRIGLPAGVQSIMYTISNIIIQANVNALGTTVIAAWAAFGKIDSFYWMIINAFGIAITTFVGQNYGAGKYDRVRKGMIQTLGMSALSTVFICTGFWFLGEYIIKLFTTDAEVVNQGMVILKFFVPSFITYIIIEILSGTSRGTGRSLVPMIMTIGGVCITRILWLAIALPIKPGIITISASYPVSWILTSIFFIIYYNGWIVKRLK
jgi:putative MATE family efflux protein